MKVVPEDGNQDLLTLGELQDAPGLPFRDTCWKRAKVTRKANGKRCVTSCGGLHDLSDIVASRDFRNRPGTVPRQKSVATGSSERNVHEFASSGRSEAIHGVR